MEVFNIVDEGDIDYQHPYMKFISYDVNSSSNIVSWLKISNPRKIPLLPQCVLKHATSMLLYNFKRFARKHGRYGTITYLRAPFHDVPLPSECVNVVTSISAIEHADINLFHENIKELSRLLKPRAPLLLTTSAATSDKDTCHEKTSDWGFSLSALKVFFSGYKIIFDAEYCARSPIESEIFIDRLDPYCYQDKDTFCYRNRVEALPYLPVAVKIVK